MNVDHPRADKPLAGCIIFPISRLTATWVFDTVPLSKIIFKEPGMTGVTRPAWIHQEVPMIQDL